MGVPGIEYSSSSYKKNTCPTVLSLQPRKLLLVSLGCPSILYHLRLLRPLSIKP